MQPAKGKSIAVEEKYYPASINMEKAGKNTILVFNKNDNSNHIMSPLSGKMLSQLSGSLTAEEHIKNILNTTEIELPESLLYDIVKEWIAQGLLRNEKLLISGNKKNSNENKTDNTFFSGCITCNRPHMLDRWLKTRTASEDYISQKIDIFISDDSIDKKIIENNELLVKKYSSRYNGKIKIVNRMHRKNYSNLLYEISEKNIPKEIIDFALNIEPSGYNAPTIGTNQNSLILGSAGSAILVNDDDIEYSFYTLSNNKEKDSVIFCDNYISSAAFYPDVKNLDINTSKIEKYNLPKVGRNFINSSLNSYLTSGQALSIISPETAMLVEKKLIKTKAVIGGYRGARWYQNPYRSLMEVENSIEQYFNDFDNYSKIKHNGLNFLAAEKTIFNNGDFFMGGTYCIDNTNIIPPVFPLGVFNDTIFGVLLNRCCGPLFSVLLPVALFHNFEIKKEFEEKDFNNISLGIGNYCLFFIKKFTQSFVSKSPEKRLIETGLRFEEAGNLNLIDFEEYLKLIQLEYISQIMANIEIIKEFYGESPSWWAEDMIKCYALLKKEVEEKDSVVPLELRFFNNKEKALSLFRDYFKKYGIALQLWPDIWNLSMQLNEEKKGLFDL